MDNLKEILGKAFKIGSEKTFDVVIHLNLMDVQRETWTYIQLGMYLIQQHENITMVHVFKKSED